MDNSMMFNLKLTLLRALPIIVAVCLQACTNDDKEAYIHYGGYHVPTPAKHLVLTNVYSYQQTTNYTCGPSVVMTLLQHYGKLSASQMNRETEMRIAKEMNTTESGTSQLDLVAWLRKNGFSVSYGQNVSLDMLINNINRGIPTIIAWNDMIEHAMLVVGYNSEGETPSGKNDVIFAADPASSNTIDDNGLTIRGIDSLSPDQLEYNQVNANFFNPTHSAIGMYIVAVPN
jgi:Peptidase_C39 like family